MKPNSLEQPQDGLLSVDFVRSLAIFFVVVTHSIASFPTDYSQSPVTWWFANGYYSLSRVCVPLFVMLSGALLLAPSKIDEPIRTFFRKRLARIALPLLFWGLVYFSWRRFSNHENLNLSIVLQNFFGVNNQYPYFHFWFLYMLIGLYLLTPLLRALVTQASLRILRYFILVWFVGATISLVFSGFASIQLSPYVFMPPTYPYLPYLVSGWVAYFILGAYLATVRLRSSITYAFFLVGFVWTIGGNWFVTVFSGTPGYVESVFTDFGCASVVFMSSSLFLLLLNQRLERVRCRAIGLFTHAKTVLRQISQHSLGIYLFHIIILEILGEKGLFGFNFGIINMNPILGIPFLAFATFVISVVVILGLTKVPMLKKAIG